MLEMIYHNRIYIAGNMKIIQKRLAEYAQVYETLRELLDAKAPPRE